MNRTQVKTSALKYLREGYLSRWLALAILGWMVLNLLVHFPDNHGDGFFGLWRVGFITLLIWIAESFFTKKLNYVSMLLLLMCLLLGLASDKYNIFISYEEWAARGMPRWGHAESKTMNFAD